MLRRAAGTSRAWLLLGAVIVMVIGLTIQGWATQEPYDLATLQGLSALDVLIEQVQPEVERAGLSRGDLKAEVMSRLSQAGIRVTASAPAFLYVNVNAVRNATGLYAVNVSVQLQQPVFLARDPRIVEIGATTWSSGVVALSQADRLVAVRQLVADILDQFVSAYHHANPQGQAMTRD